MTTFDELAASRRQWINETLVPWCRAASLKDLRRAEQEWGDIAGKVDPQLTLWTWAWSRFPGLVVEGLPGLDETYPVTVTLRSGDRYTGYPDSRKSRRGELVLVGEHVGEELGPFSLDQIAGIERAAEGSAGA